VVAYRYYQVNPLLARTEDANLSISGLCLAVGILCFPSGWDNEEVRAVCEEKADSYSLGTCGVRWVYLLAVIAFCDAIILGE
jgi:hypothetical protein